MNKTVVELFAGVGGFRVGLNSVKLDASGHTIEENRFKFVWANQWEPSKKIQNAFECYQTRFGVSESHVNENISKIDKNLIPDHTLLVGGFPCQDYSVARSLSKEQGIEGKKGVLWWEIDSILKAKKPPFVLLENVDRLLKSPSRQRGRDFGIMLRCFADCGYDVEWRVINAAEYGFAQKRKRVFIFAYLNTTNHFKLNQNSTPSDLLQRNGLFASEFPVHAFETKISNVNLSDSNYKDLVYLSDSFFFNFENSGYMTNGLVYTVKSKPIIKDAIPLRNILSTEIVDKKYFIEDESKFIFLKGYKKELRVTKDGFEYYYSEGAMSYPDSLDRPARTMLTSESSVNRSTHVVPDLVTGNHRLITPIEAEKLNGFPENWTKTGMTEKQRYFMMGNALVCGIVENLGLRISNIIDLE